MYLLMHRVSTNVVSLYVRVLSLITAAQLTISVLLVLVKLLFREYYHQVQNLLQYYIAVVMTISEWLTKSQMVKGQWPS